MSKFVGVLVVTLLAIPLLAAMLGNSHDPRIVIAQQQLCARVIAMPSPDSAATLPDLATRLELLRWCATAAK